MTDNVETTPQTEVTNDLKAFSDELYGVAAPKPANEEDKIVEPTVEPTEEVDPSATQTEVTEEEDGDPSTPPKKNKQTAKERIDELTALRHEAERKAAAREAELLAEIRLLRESKEPVKETPPATSAAPVKDEDAPPDPLALQEDGETPVYALGQFDPEFQADWVKYQFNQQLKAREAEEAAKQAQTEAQRQFETITTRWQEKVANVVETLPDFETKGMALESTFANLEPQYGQYLARTIMEMDHGPEVLYYLANNVEEAHAIAAKGPAQATLALGRLEAQFTGNAPKPIKESTAPTPPTQPLRGQGGRFRVAGDTKDLDAFMKEFYGA